MEQPCYKCGQPVEQGIPFCPHCSAPQIRVMVAELAPSPAVFDDAGTPSPGVATLPASQTVPMLALPMQWSRAIRPCALAVVVASLLMVLGLNSLVGMLCVGFLAVVFYRQRTPEASIRLVDGARLGALGGILWFGVFVLLLSMLVVALREMPELHDELLKQIHQTASSPSVPQLQEFLDHIKTRSGLAVLILSAFVTALLLGTLGGVLGGAIFRRRDRP
jgi:hypothetical protein